MKRLLFVLAAAAAFWTAACSSGGGSTTPPPPMGKYSDASLNGTYAFTTSGEVFTGTTAAPMARVGSFIADGKGGISGGTEDVNTAGSPSGAATITGGSYNVNPDGRGTLLLNIGQSSINFGIVVTSTTDGLMIDETSNASQSSTGSGNFTLQDPTVCTSPVTSVSGTYVFDFSGLDSSGLGLPESFVGEFTANNGATTANMGDINDGFTLSNGSFTATFSPSTLPPAGPTACGRGTAQFTTTQTGLQTYAFYVVNSKRVRFINTAGGEMLSGDAVLQTSVPASLSSGFAFIVSGSSLNGGLIRVGRFTVNGATVSDELVDTNDAGLSQFTQTTGATAASITLDSANPGRGTVTFLGNGLSVPFTFVFYLSSASSGVIQETTQSNTSVVAVADGSIAAQSGSPFTSSNISGTYALNWSGLSNQNTSGFPVQDEEDFVGQATISNLALTGAADIFLFQVGFPQRDNIVGGSISINGDGTGTGGSTTRNTMKVILTKGSSTTVNCNVYFVSPQFAFFETNSQSPNRVVAGVLELQQ
jgi:hypothetical protein